MLTPILTPSNSKELIRPMLGNPRVAHWLPAHIPLLILPWATASPHKAPYCLISASAKGFQGGKHQLHYSWKVPPDQMRCQDHSEARMLDPTCS